ncbi:TonB-dependent receptor [Bacteroides acidifaciens]|uniref:TonB-dependent receptor n=1 Tax=Bacteroides acidifaciens TaxID=85831 RepID=UPI00243168FD|nr:TonB-dependent receptor plug domain-containing protein [Bacteroides acidifaciens]
MRKDTTCLFLLAGLLSVQGAAQNKKDSTQFRRNYIIDEVVVTGTRNETDVRHLPMTISVVGRQQIEKRYEPSLLPLLTEQVPGLFTTSRGIMGYGVSTGAAGDMSLRGVGGSPTAGLLVLIDGHPQYMGLMGHPIANAYQSMMTERVEVLRGPASVLYGSNAMGEVVNIVTRKQQEEGVNTNMQVGYGSYNTLQTEFANRVKKGRFSSIVTGSYNQTDGHRPDMEFEQYGGYAKLGYEINSFWKLWGDVNANYSWLYMENPVLAAPGHKLYAGADYSSGCWSVSTGLQYVKGLYTSVTKGREQQEDFVLWNLRGNYRVCRFASLFVKGENLLAQRYEINAGYSMPKATFMGGINLNF